jgi:hypothetical protein
LPALQLDADYIEPHGYIDTPIQPVNPGFVREMSITLNMEDVTPEPSSLILLCGSAALFMHRRRRSV